jgi:3-(3-hydroxy-phenyl)propionate hydroxylase
VSQPRTETRNDYQVVVIGFGPSGAVATSLLGSYGIRTLTVDRLNDVYDKPRAIAIDHEILRLFDNLGVADRVLPFVAPFPASQHFGAEGQLIRRIDMVPEPYPLGYTPSMVFTQPPVEEALRDHAASYNSVDISLGTELLELRQSVNGVTLNMRRDGSEARTVTADYVIACDGASSSVREQLGIALEDLVFDEPWLVVDVLVNEDALGKLPETAAQYCDPARPTTYIIGPGNHRRWEIMLLPDEDPRAAQQPEEVWKLLSKWLTPDDATLWRAASYRFHALVAREWRRGRIFLAGDAAHQQPPFIGQGMCQGLRDVSNLIWKLARVIKGESDDTLLDTYAEERSEHVRQLTTRIKAIGKVICERDPEAARERDARILAEGGGQPRTITRQEIVPPLQKGLLATRDDGARGTLFPQPWVQTSSGRSLLDRVVGTGWRLFLDHGNFPGLSEDAQRQADDLGLHVIKVGMAKEPASAGPSEAHDAFVELDNVLAKWFESHGCRAAIVRPDHYVFGAAPDEGSLSNLMADLRARLQPTNARIPQPENSSVSYHARTGP